MSRHTKRAILIAVFFGVPVLAAIGVSWAIGYWEDWRTGMVLLTLLSLALAGYMIKDAL